MIVQSNTTISLTSRTFAPQSLPSSRPTSPDRGLLVAAGLQDLSLCPCPIPQPLAGSPMWQLPVPGPLSAPSGCSYLKRASPALRLAIQLVSSVNLLTSASSTTKRLCTGKSAWSNAHLSYMEPTEGCICKNLAVCRLNSNGNLSYKKQG